MTPAEYMETVRGHVEGPARQFLQGVLGEGDVPSYVYTVGRWQNLGQSELALVGLPPSVSMSLLNQITLDGRVLDEWDDLGEFVRKGYPLVVRRVSTVHVRRFGVAYRFYRFDVSFQQLVWSDAERRLPWEVGYTGPDQMRLCERPVDV